MSNRSVLTGLTNEQLLAEVEDVIRSMPNKEKLHHTNQATFAWIGRALAILQNWNLPHGLEAASAVEAIQSGRAVDGHKGKMKLMVLLNHAQSDLRLKTIGPVNVAIGQGEVFRYFDALRQVVELAKADVLFVDRYMGADFVAKYLPHVSRGVTVRLLSREQIPALASAVGAFAKQYGTQIEVRSSNDFHDRWIFIDRSACYQSGASFKDGGRKDGTTLTQNVDAFSVLHSMYEGIWQKAAVHPLLA